MELTKNNFLNCLEKECRNRYEWAKDETRLQHYISIYRESITTEKRLLQIDGPVAIEIWNKLGGKGKLTFKAIRAIPLE